MAPSVENVVVAGTGAVHIAPSGTSLPTTLAALASPWVDVGYTSEAGVKFTLSREQDVVNAWQSAEPVRVLLTKEPKVIAFELLEFGNPASLELALRGGTLTAAVLDTPPITYTPPAAGAADIRAMVIDAIDGDNVFRFCYAAVELSGNVEWSLVRSAAIVVPLEFNVLAGGWKIISDHPSWSSAAVLASVERPSAARRREPVEA